MIALIEEVRKDLDSIGGICELVAVGVPPGWGEPVFDKLKADLAKGLLSLPAVTAFEYGAGFAVATARGSQNNDVFIPKTGGTSAPKRNRHGGMLGGISSGEPIVMPRGREANQQPAATAEDRNATGRADRNRHPRPARSVLAAAFRADGRGNGGDHARRPLAPLAIPMRIEQFTTEARRTRR